MKTDSVTPQAKGGCLQQACSALLRGYCLIAFVFVQVLHIPVFAIYRIGHLAEWLMEHVTCRAGDHIRKVWRHASRPNVQTHTQEGLE